MKKLKFLFSKKGVISLYGVVVALIVCIMLCGYMDLTQTTHVVEEIQSIMDITALSTLQGSLDAEGVRFDRLTLREYTYFLPDDTGISQAERLAINAETDDAELLEALKADSEQLQAVTIWIDGTNADNVNDIAVERIILKNFDYYLTKLLHTGSGASKQPLFDFAHGGLDNLLDYNGNSIIKKYEIREFDAGLVYSSWGVDAENSEGYQKVPQAYLASTIVLYLSVEPTFSSMNLNVEESHVYNALNSANSSSMLHVEGYTDDGLLAVSIRTLSRMTVQGFIASDDTADVGDLGANLDALPYTPEEYFDITDDGIVTGFSEEYYALPQAERPTTIKMPRTIRGITPIAIGDNAFDETENDDNIELMALPDSIKTIGKEAFKNAEYMKTFGFVGASKLDTIKESAFNGCKALLTFSCPSGLTEIPPFAFYGCTSLTTFNFNNGLTKIGISAFENCSRLRGELHLSNTITMIDSKAFFNCSSITKINVPEKLNGLGSAAFGRLSSLALVEKHANNTNFEAIDNVLFQKEGDGTYALIVYPAQRKNTIYTIPLVQGQLVTRIADYAFYGNKYLDTLTYDSGDSAESPEMLHGVKVVGESAFERCVELKTLQFAGDLVNEGGALVREGLQVVGANAFYNTPAMSLIYIDKLKDSVAGSPWGANTFITTIRWKADDSFDWSKIYLYNQAGVILSLSDYGAEVVKSDPNFELVIPSTINDPYWGEIAITAIGNNAFSTNPEHSRYADANSKISKQPEFIANVTSIGSYAFEGTMIENFTLPDSVTSIGDGAFAKSALVNFIINESAADTIVFGNYVFDGCANLAEFVIPYRVAEVGIGMFKDCISMQRVVIDTTWVKLPDYTFSGCSKLNSIEAPHTIIEIGDYCFADCATLRGIGLTRQLQIVGKYAFTGCNTLEVVNFGDTITTIKENAFFKTPVLATVYLDVEEDFVPGQPWGAESFTDIIWRNSKWAKYYIYEAAPNGTWKIVGLSELGRKVLTDKSLTAFETPAYYEGAEIVGFSMTKAEDKTALKNLTKMKIVAVKHNQGYPIADASFEGCTSLRAFEMSSTITSIGAKVFKDCNVLTKISIPASVTSLGAYAFQNCSSLQQVTLGVGVTDIKEYTFQNCTNLQTLGILGDFTNVGTYAFQNCKSLPTFHIKDSCATIGDYAFENCSTLLTVTCDGNPSITTFNTGLFKNSGLKTIQMPKTLKTINSQAFYDCKSLTTINNSDTCALTTINEEAFMNTTSLSELPSFPQLQTIGVKSFYNTGAVTIQSQPALTVINSNAFQNSLKLKTFKSCNSLYTIGSYAFKGCTALQTIQAHSSLNTISTEAFYNCTGLTTFANQPSLNTIKSYAFYNTTKLEEFNQDSVKTVEEYAFRYSGIKQFVSSSITNIGYAAFLQCTRLTNISCSSKVAFGEESFVGCTALTTIYAPSMTSISDHAFQGCTSLSSVSKSDSLTTIGAYVFKGSIFKSYHVGSAITTIDANAFSGSAINTLHMHVGEYKSRTISNHSNSTTTITNSRANEPWGADGAYVRWYNTLIVNGVTVSSSTTAVSQKQALTYVAPGQGSYSESITVQYDGDAVNDLTWLKSKAITRGNTLAWSYNNGTIQYNASNNTNGYTDKATLTEAYTGAVATIQWDMDNALIFDGQDSHVLDVPWSTSSSGTVTTYGGTIKYTDSDWSTLSVTASAAEISRCDTYSNGLVKFESEPAAGGGHSGEVVITFSGEDTNGVTQSTKVIVRHTLYFVAAANTDAERTGVYGKSRAAYIRYSGDGDGYLTYAGGGNGKLTNATSQQWMTKFVTEDDMTLTATDGYVSASAPLKLYFQDYFKSTANLTGEVTVYMYQSGQKEYQYQYVGPVSWMSKNMEKKTSDPLSKTTMNYMPSSGFLYVWPTGASSPGTRTVAAWVERESGNAGGRVSIRSGTAYTTVETIDARGVG